MTVSEEQVFSRIMGQNPGARRYQEGDVTANGITVKRTLGWVLELQFPALLYQKAEGGHASSSMTLHAK